MNRKAKELLQAAANERFGVYRWDSEKQAEYWTESSVQEVLENPENIKFECILEAMRRVTLAMLKANAEKPKP
jgi:hypothetical protein